MLVLGGVPAYSQDLGTVRIALTGSGGRTGWAVYMNERLLTSHRTLGDDAQGYVWEGVIPSGAYEIRFTFQGQRWPKGRPDLQSSVFAAQTIHKFSLRPGELVDVEISVSVREDSRDSNYNAHHLDVTEARGAAPTAAEVAVARRRAEDLLRTPEGRTRVRLVTLNPTRAYLWHVVYKFNDQPKGSVYWTVGPFNYAIKTDPQGPRFGPVYLTKNGSGLARDKYGGLVEGEPQDPIRAIELAISSGRHCMLLQDVVLRNDRVPSARRTRPKPLELCFDAAVGRTTTITVEFEEPGDDVVVQGASKTYAHKVRRFEARTD